jgi:hypothetical protein
MRAAIVLAGVLAAWLPAAPAMAWGPLAHGLVAQRAFAELAPRMPWLAPHRDAFIWGAVCADMQEAPASFLSHERTHAVATVKALWREAVASRDRGAQAFAVGWAVHVGADEAFDGFVSAHAEGWPTAQAEVPRAALLGWAADEALLPRSGQALFQVGKAAAVHVGTPAAAAIEASLAKTLAVDINVVSAWARLVAGTCLGGPDRYLAERSRSLRVEPWIGAAREPAAREALGDLTGWITRGVQRGVDRARALSKAPAAPRHDKREENS